jgi:phosphoketolase
VNTTWRSIDLSPVGDGTLAQLNSWWRATNSWRVGQICLLHNPLLRTPLSRRRQTPPARPLGHHAGPNFHAHLNRAIKERNQ